MRALEELYDEGKVKAIGVYNFTQDRLADYLFFNKIKPVVNIIECNEINLDIFDLKLTEDEMAKIASLYTEHTYAMPRNT